MTELGQEVSAMKECSHCGEIKPLNEFLRRTGKKAAKSSRRGTCRDCRKQLAANLTVPVRELPVHPHSIVQLPIEEMQPASHRLDVPEENGQPADERAADDQAAPPRKKRRRRSRKSAGTKAAMAAEEATEGSKLARSLDDSATEPVKAGEADLGRDADRAEAEHTESEYAESENTVADAPTPDAEAGQPAKKRRKRTRRKANKKDKPHTVAEVEPLQAPAKPVFQPAAPPKRVAPIVTDLHASQKASALIPTRAGIIRMRGRTDNGRGWYQEIDPELAAILVREHAAVIVNRHTIKRLYSNKEFRRLILTRDNYQCYFCGEYGDTIDHVLPRAKGGHTTPDNCVCACMLCNQTKADQYEHDFRNGKA